MSFEDLKGQDYAKQVLGSGLRAGRMASTLLFFGPPGVGKKTAALALAKSLMVSAETSAERIQAIHHRIESGNHPDVLIFKPMGSSFKVEQVREILHECSMKAFEGLRRVILLDRVELLTDSAGNALLKTLEEPPQGTVFILVTAQPDKVLSTITSRAQPVRFAPLGEKVLLTLLKQECEQPEKVLMEAARLSGGSLTRAKSLLGEEGLHLKELAEGFLEAVFADTPLGQMNWAQLASADRRLAPGLMDLLGVYLRDVWCRQHKFPQELCILKQAPRHGGGLSPQRLERLMKALGQLQRAWGRRPSLNLALAMETLVTSAPDTLAA